jgi:hypothetical protein
MRHVERTLDADLTLLGVPTRLSADDPRLLDAALEAFGSWSDPGSADAAPVVSLRLRFNPDTAPGRAPDVRVDGPRVPLSGIVGSRLTLSGGGADGWADAGRGEGGCAVPAGLLAEPERLAAEVLDPLALFLLTRSGRVPLHAAGILVGQTAVLLAGRSGAGKSTLALAAHGAGMTVLSDDTVYVQTRPALRVWGLPRPIHVFADDARAALAEPAGTRLRNGRLKAAVPVSTPSAPPSAARAVLFLLERGDSVALRPITPNEAVDAMLALLEPGFDHFREALPEAVRAVAAAGAWRLTLSADPAQAVAAVRRSVGASP